MQRVLAKRVLRDIKANFFRYFALFLLIILSMYLITSILSAAETVIKCTEETNQSHQVEDGFFGVFVPLTEEEVGQIEAKGVTLQKDFSMDFHVGENDVIFRVYSYREKIDLFTAAQGEDSLKAGEILVEQHFAEKHDLTVGDSLTVGGKDFTIAGIGCTPDYDGLFEKISDSSADSKQFGLGFVTEEDYDNLKEGGQNFKTEEYNYSYRLNDAITDDQLQELIQSFELDKSLVTDKYFLEMIDTAEEDKKNFQDGILELVDGVDELVDGVDELAAHNSELTDAADQLMDAMVDQVNDSLKEAGLEVTLTSANYRSQLDAMIANPSTYSQAMRQNLMDAKDTLEEIEEYRDGIKKYSDGTNAAAEGSEKLLEGVNQLRGQNDTLNKGAESIYSAVAGLVSQMSPMLPEEQATGLSSQLESIAKFRDGVKAYTAGVDAVAEGNKELTKGMKELYSASTPLMAATDQVVDGLIDMVEEELKASDIEVELTKDNYKIELDRIASDGTIDSELSASLTEARDTLGDIKEFKDGIVEYTDAVNEIGDGCQELRDGVQELQDETNDFLEEYFDFDLDNLTQFIKAEDNPRIAAAAGDVEINLTICKVMGVVLVLMFTYVISVFVVHSIEKESQVIGALYAMGLTRRQLIAHYLLNPVMIAFLGGVVGYFAGVSPYGATYQMADSTTYYSLPPLETYVPTYLLIYNLAMPPIVAATVNYFVINRKLNCTALSLLRNEGAAGHASKFQRVDLGRLSFLPRFQIRQLFCEFRSAIAVVGGMFLCLFILMISLDCYVYCDNFQNKSAEETTYEYMYTYKYPTENPPEGGTAIYVEGLKKMSLGYNLEVSLMGLDQDNPYFDIQLSDKKNEVVISRAAAQKFDLALGDKIVLSDEVNERDYAFTVAGVSPQITGIYAFMDIDAMRDLFNQEDDYYNVVLSDRELDIDAGRLYSTVDKEKVAQSSKIFSDMMAPMVYTIVGVSAFIFMIVMYLMIKVMIDRSAFSISLMKVFGYRKGEIRRLYLDGNFIIIVVSALICIPASKALVDQMYPSFVANIAIGYELAFSAELYLAIFVGIILCYLVINFLLTLRLNKLLPADVLKNRE